MTVSLNFTSIYLFICVQKFVNVNYFITLRRRVSVAVIWATFYQRVTPQGVAGS